jgi:hypothetical protein
METQEKADYEKFKAKKPQEIDRPFFFDVKIEILLSNSTNYFSQNKKKKKYLTNSANSKKDNSEVSGKKKIGGINNQNKMLKILLFSFLLIFR